MSYKSEIVRQCHRRHDGVSCATSRYQIMGQFHQIRVSIVWRRYFVLRRKLNSDCVCRNPTPDGKPVEFLPIDNDHTHFLDIHNDDLIPGEDPHRENIHFWTELERQYRKLVRTGASSESKNRD